MRRIKFAAIGEHPLMLAVTRELQVQGYTWEMVEPDFIVAGAFTSYRPEEIMEDYIKRKWTPPILVLSSGDVYSDRDHLLQQLDRTKMPETWGHVITSPLDMGARRKLHMLLMENYFLSHYDNRAMVVRVFDVYGGVRPSVVHDFVYAAHNKQPLLVHSPGYQERTFLHTDDAVEAIMLLKDRLLKGSRGIYNVGHPDPISIMALAKTVQQFYRHNDVRIEVVDNPNHRRAWWRVPDIARITADTKWKPKVSLRQGIWRLSSELK